jgi:acetoin:2,6-dichlorophenolindophenol oxidoreductase subunit beta
MSTHSGRELTIGQAVNEALAEEMRRDPAVIVLGEDVAEAGTPFKVLKGLVEEFGPKRVIDTPISEAGFTGIAPGAAMTGLRPVVDIMFGDFLTLVMDQVVNQAAKVHYLSGGKLRAPMVVRTTLGATRRSAAQHSQSPRSSTRPRRRSWRLAASGTAWCRCTASPRSGAGCG